MEPQELKSHQQCETYYKVLICIAVCKVLSEIQKFQLLQQDPIQYFNLYISDLCKYAEAFFNLLVGSKDATGYLISNWHK